MKVKLKSAAQFQEMRRKGEIELVHLSDSGEWTTYATKTEPQHIMRFCWSDMGSEYLVVDHPAPISKEQYEACKVFFETG